MDKLPLQVGDKVTFPDVTFKRNSISFKTLSGVLQSISGHTATIKRGKHIIRVPLQDVSKHGEQSAVGKYFQNAFKADSEAGKGAK